MQPASRVQGKRHRLPTLSTAEGTRGIFPKVGKLRVLARESTLEEIDISESYRTVSVGSEHLAEHCQLHFLFTYHEREA